MASSVIKAMITSELATPNSTYIGTNYLHVTKIGQLVNVCGRFQVATAKPSGADNYLFSGLPAPNGVIVGYELPEGVELIINQSGYLTSNGAVSVGYKNVQFTYYGI